MSNNKVKKNLLSVDFIKEIFIKINDKIKSLHDYSNKDFYSLNDSFKNNFQASKKIFNNSQLLINSLTENTSFEILDDFENFKKGIISYYHTFKSEIKQQIKRLETIENSSNTLKFYLNNVNQNLLTFNFLLSNYNIFHFQESDFGAGIHKQIQNIKYHIAKLLNNTDQLNNKVDILKQKSEEIIEYINVAQERLNTDLEDSYNLVIQKKQEAGKGLKELESKGEISQNINDIITNLQYHDILKQKMEHIQKIHNDVIARLQILEKKIKDKKDENQIAECLLYIKDIAELQSAQLLHVNKKYQYAIKIISENIQKISENTNTVNTISQEIMGYTSKNNLNFLFNISSAIENIYKKFLEIHYSFIELTGFLKEFKNIQTELIYEFDNINKFYVEFKNSSIGFIETMKTDERKNTEISKQFKVITDEIIASKTEINNNLNITTDILFNLYRNNKSIHLIDEAQNNFLPFADVFVQKLKIHSREVNQKLIENKNICRSITSNIQHSLNQVKYYEYFEKIIEEITNELDNLNESISFKIKSQLSDKEKKLGKLKKHYTTGSEHDIHDIYIEEGKRKSEQYEDKNNEGNNIEFF